MPDRAQIQGPKILHVMAGIERAIIDGRTETIRKAAMAAKVIHSVEIDRASGGDGVLSGVGVKGAKVGARFDMKGSTFDPEAMIKAYGPLHLLDFNTASHMIRSKYMRGSQAKRGSLAGGTFKRRKVIGPTLSPVINIPGIGYRRWAKVRGTRGVHSWDKGRIRAEPVIRKIMHKGMFTIIQKAAKP
jgi:hypothetical protein